ncbi:MAG: phosphoribosylanthranilate isomerase [Gemmatimonadaceae bacterium]|nr:phosphoribosylanthranilate isomerase [Gemmatimonadaceae bacterium]
MLATRIPRIKICCISSRAEATIAVRAGASAIGLVSSMPSGPGVIHNELIAEIARTIPPGVASFLLTCCETVGEIVGHQRAAGVNTLQLVDRLPHGSHDSLRRALPGISIVQVIHVTGEESIEEAVSVAPNVNAVLLDSGNPALAIKELGGTGRRHDWRISRQIRELLDIPVFLAGGLRPDNVAEAIEEVGPYGLDVCSGVRTNGDLDEAKVNAFIRQSKTHSSEPAFDS